MDATYFLKQRTNFIRFLYDESEKPFVDIKRRIEVKEPPYDNPPYSEDGEPPYLEQWFDADVARDVVGLTCVSLLSDTLKLYFLALETRVIGFAIPKADKQQLFRDGYLSAYKVVLGEILQTDWSDCPADFSIIEQVVLARNRGQHGTELASLRVTHDSKTLTKHPRPFFAEAEETAAWAESGGSPESFMTPDILISRDRLFAAIGEVVTLAEWIDGKMDRAWVWRSGGQSVDQK